jgi:hypothetical protein
VEDTAVPPHEPINHSTRIKGSKDEKRRRTVGRPAGRHAASGCWKELEGQWEGGRGRGLFFSFYGSLPRSRPRARARHHFLLLSFSKFVGRLAIVRAREDSRETGPSVPGAHGTRFIN